MIGDDDSRWPLLIHVFDGATTVAQLETWLAQVDTYLARGDKMLTLAVARDLKFWEAAALRRGAGWMRENEERIRQRSLGFAFVLPSPLAPPLLPALFSMQPLPHHPC